MHGHSSNRLRLHRLSQFHVLLYEQTALKQVASLLLYLKSPSRPHEMCLGASDKMSFLSQADSDPDTLRRARIFLFPGDGVIKDQANPKSLIAPKPSHVQDPDC